MDDPTASSSAFDRVMDDPTASSFAFERGVHYSLLEREGKSQRNAGVPLWRSAENVVRFDPDATRRPIKREVVAGVVGAFTLSNVLTHGECHQLRELSEAMGYRPEPSLASGRPLRTNCNLLWVADTSLWEPIWQRVRPFLPSIDGCAPLGLNHRLRLYKYDEGDAFGLHHDGAWPGSGLRAGVYVRDLWAGAQRSQCTLLLYLDDLDAYDGGATTFQTDPEAEGGGARVAVRVPQGGALCFFHGEHALSPLHEGSAVTRGVKHVVRTDVLYRAPLADGDDDQAAEEQIEAIF